MDCGMQACDSVDIVENLVSNMTLEIQGQTWM